MSKRFTALIAVAFSLALVLACVGQKSGTSCEHSACPNGGSCNLKTHLCVSALPRISINTPSSTDLVESASVILSGTVGSDFQISAVQYRIGGDAGTWTSLSLTDGGFSSSVNLPPVDDVPVLVEVQALDQFQRMTEATVSPRVDNVYPTGQFNVADATHNAPRVVTLTFSEPVFVPDGGAPFTVLPPAGAGTWDSNHQSYSYALAVNTKYTATFTERLVFDNHSRTNQDGGTSTFWTEIQPPPSFFVLDGGGLGVADIDAASDDEGTVTLVMQNPTAPSGNYVAIRFDPSTGNPISAGSVSGDAGVFQAQAQVIYQDDFSPVHADTGSFHTLLREFGAAVVGTAGGSLNVVSPTIGYVLAEAPCGSDHADLGTSILRSSNMYTVTRESALGTLNFAPDFVAVRSANDWEIIGIHGNGLFRQQYTATCDGTQILTRQFHASSQLASNLAGTNALAPRLSFALDKGTNAIYVFDDLSSHRVQLCFTCDATGICSSDTVNTPPAADLHVAPMHQDSWVLGARRNDAGTIEILKRDLNQSCSSDWDVVGQVPANVSANATTFRPVMFGKHPGIVILNPSDVVGYWL